MEQESGERIRIALDVIIAYRGLGLVRGITRDIGLDGAFVETGRVMLPMYASVEVSIPSGSGPDRNMVRIRGFVSHVSRKGVGILFTDDARSVERALETTLEWDDGPVAIREPDAVSPHPQTPVF